MTDSTQDPSNDKTNQRIPSVDTTKYPEPPKYYWVPEPGTVYPNVQTAYHNIIIYFDQHESTTHRSWTAGDDHFVLLNNYSRHFLAHNSVVYDVFQQQFPRKQHQARIVGFVGDSVMIMLAFSKEALRDAFKFADAVIDQMRVNHFETTAIVVDGVSAELNLVGKSDENTVLGQTVVGPAVDLAVRLSWIAGPHQILYGYFGETPSYETLKNSWSFKPEEPPRLTITLDKWTFEKKEPSEKKERNSPPEETVFVVTRKDHKNPTYPQNSRRIFEYLYRLNTLDGYSQVLDKQRHHTILNQLSTQNFGAEIDALQRIIDPMSPLCELPVPAELLGNGHPADVPDMSELKTIFRKQREVAQEDLKKALELIKKCRFGPFSFNQDEKVEDNKPITTVTDLREQFDKVQGSTGRLSHSAKQLLNALSKQEANQQR